MVIVVPMPARAASTEEESWMRALASTTSEASRSSTGCGPSGSPCSSTSIAICEATSPAGAPPMPSATPNSGARTNQRSSFVLR